MSYFGQSKTKKIKKNLMTSEQKKNKSDDLEGKQQPDFKDPKLKGITRFCKIRYYQKYFDVTTGQIIKRVFKAMFPWDRQPIFETGKPDLYGPLWVYV